MGKPDMSCLSLALEVPSEARPWRGSSRFASTQILCQDIAATDFRVVQSLCNVFCRITFGPYPRFRMHLPGPALGQHRPLFILALTAAMPQS